MQNRKNKNRIACLALFTLSGLFALLTGCKTNATGFDMSYQRLFTMQSGLSPAASHTFVFADIASDTSVFFNLHNVNSNDVTRIEPKSMRLQTQFSGLDYNFIDRIEVRIAYVDKPNDYQIIFFRDEIPTSTGDRIELLPNNVDIRPYLLKGKFTVRLVLTQLRQINSNSIESALNFTFFARTN